MVISLKINFQTFEFVSFAAKAMRRIFLTKNRRQIPIKKGMVINMNTLLAATSIASTISLVVLGILGVLVLIGALKGLSRGISRQVIRTASIILSVVISFILVKISYSAIFGYFDGKTVEDIIADLSATASSAGVQLNPEDFASLSNFDAATVKYILAIPLALIIMPLAFTVSFVIISALMLIVHAIVSGVLGFSKKKNNATTRLLGMALGAVQGLFVAIVLLFPILGIANVAADSIETMRQNENKSEAELEIIELYDANIKEAVESPAVRIMSSVGGNLLYKMVSTAKIDGDSIAMSEQVAPVVSIYAEYSSKLVDADFTKLTEENKEGINAIIEELEASDYFKPLLAGIVKGAANTIAESEAMTEMEEPVKSIFASIITIFQTSDKTNIVSDVSTLRDLYFLLSDEGILAAVMGEEGGEGTDILKLLSNQDENGKTALSRAINILQINDRTKPIVGSLTKLSITMLASGSAGGEMTPEQTEQIEQVYEDVKTGLNEVVQVKREDYASDEEHKAAVSDTLENVLVDNNILSDSFIEENREEVDKVMDAVSDRIIEDLADVEEVTDDVITVIIVEYYDALVSGEFGDIFGEGEEIPDIGDLGDIPGIG